MKRLFILLFIYCVTVFASVAQSLNFNGSDAASVGIFISELSTGRELYTENPDKVFIPASVMKCVTAASAIKSICSDSPFTTSVMISGHVSKGILHGDIIIKGSGDPTIDSRHVALRGSFVDEVANSIVSQGIDSIAGDIMIDISALPEIGVSPYWLLEDIAWEYGAGLYGFNYCDNSFSMKVSTDQVLSMKPAIPDLDVKFNLQRGSGDVMAMRGEESYTLTLSGSIAGADYTSLYSMPFPDMVFRTTLIETLQKRGIGCLGESSGIDSDKLREILSHKSPSRNEILRPMMFKSVNLYAEAMLRALVKDSDNRTANAAINIEKNTLKSIGVDLSNMKIADGSGLAVTNRLSPRFLGSLLTKMAQSDDAKNYVSLFPAVGKEGSVRSLLADTRLAGKLVMKSGSMSGVLCYAGYKLDDSGQPTHVVIIMVNGFTCRVTEVRSAVNKWLLTQF